MQAWEDFLEEVVPGLQMRLERGRAFLGRWNRLRPREGEL